jgi:hypothetical protein
MADKAQRSTTNGGEDLALRTSSTELMARIEPTLEAIDSESVKLRDLFLTKVARPSDSIRQAAAMQSLRELMTGDVMKPIMALQNNALGFKTDKSEGYPESVVRDVAITAMGRGAAMTGNRINIISGQCYLTKEYFAEKLDEHLGSANWQFVHGIPRTQRGVVMRRNKSTNQYEKTDGVVGALLDTEVRWRTSRGDDWQTQTLTHALKGDDYATSDAYLGKADRKCGAWLFAQVSGERAPDGDVGEINITAVGEDRPAPKRPASTVIDSILNGASDEALDESEGEITPQRGTQTLESDDPATAVAEAAAKVYALIDQVVEAVGVPADMLEAWCASLPRTDGYHARTMKQLTVTKLKAMLRDAGEINASVNAWFDEQNQG